MTRARAAARRRHRVIRHVGSSIPRSAQRRRGCCAATLLPVAAARDPNASRQGMANRLLAGGFQDVDRTGTPEAFAEYLEHIGTDERVRRLNRKRAEAAGIAAGHRVLDVGCGVGFDASLLAELVAPAGKVIGIDHSAAMVERSAARLAGSGLPVAFRAAAAHALHFDGGAFGSAG